MELPRRSGETEFILYVREGDSLVEVVDQLNYLRITLDQYNNYWLAMCRNIRTPRKFWVQLKNILQWEETYT